MSTRKCKECDGELEINGTGYYGDTIEVECSKCHEVYEVESDGLGEAGEEFIDACMADLFRASEGRLSND
jgi:hypothetical protein